MGRGVVGPLAEQFGGMKGGSAPAALIQSGIDFSMRRTCSAAAPCWGGFRSGEMDEAGWVWQSLPLSEVGIGLHIIFL